MGQSDTSTEYRPVPANELPVEFQKLETPFGLPFHYPWTVVLLTQAVCILYTHFYMIPAGIVPFSHVLIAALYIQFNGLGVTIGAHRYWTHRTFKAKLPLQILLMILYTASFHKPLFRWVSEHRVHHKYTDTDADPHNSKRGFWFSHIGWLMQPRHPKCQEKLDTIPISDVAYDAIVRFQSKYYFELTFTFAFLLPGLLGRALLPDFSVGLIFVGLMSVHATSAHCTFLVNSAAHIWGSKPYDRELSSTDTKWVSLFAAGEGWHNYHHTFPWDYKAAELPWTINISTMIIDLFAWMGLAYDLKTVSQSMLAERIARTGDGSHPLHQTKENEEPRIGERTEADKITIASWGFADATDQLKQLNGKSGTNPISIM